MRFNTSYHLARAVHIGAAMYQVAYIYTPLHNWERGLAAEQWGAFPLLLLSGAWLMYGRKLKQYVFPRISPSYS